MAETKSQADQQIVDETGIAAAINMSVAWLRKDRRGKREIPFFRIGGRIRYDVATVRKVLISRTEGGTKR